VWVLLILNRLKPDLLKNQDKGFDGGKNVFGRKRNLVVDTLGLPMAVRVTSARPHDSTVAPLVLTGLKKKFPRLQKVLGDCGYSGPLQNWFMLHTRGCLLSIVKRSDEQKGFHVLKQRWIVERTFSWIGNYRRLSKDYEMSASSSEAFIALALIKTMLKNLN
jgi:putative transposase